MKIKEGEKIPDDFAEYLEACYDKRQQLDATLKVALDHHTDRVQLIAKDNDRIWRKIFDHFDIEYNDEKEKSKWYASKSNGIWIISERSESNPYRISEEGKE